MSVFHFKSTASWAESEFAAGYESLQLLAKNQLTHVEIKIWSLCGFLALTAVNLWWSIIAVYQWKHLLSVNGSTRCLKHAHNKRCGCWLTRNIWLQISAEGRALRHVMWRIAKRRLRLEPKTRASQQLTDSQTLPKRIGSRLMSHHIIIIIIIIILTDPEPPERDDGGVSVSNLDQTFNTTQTTTWRNATLLLFAGDEVSHVCVQRTSF